MFGFGKSSKDPLSDIKAAERWLATLPGADTLAVHSNVIDELERATGAGANRTPQRLRAVFHVDAQTGAQRRALIGQYIEHASRSSKIENQLWTALFGLTQGFLQTYQSFAREIVERPQSGRWQELMPELICRQLVHLALDARVRLFRYEQWIPAKWAELHGLMSLACSQQVERQLVSLTESSTTSIEHEYLRALVLHLMNAGSLTASQVTDLRRSMAALRNHSESRRLRQNHELSNSDPREQRSCRPTFRPHATSPARLANPIGSFNVSNPIRFTFRHLQQ